MLLTEQDAKTKWCWQPRNAEMRCKASDCAMWRWWPCPVDASKTYGYCGLAGAPLVVAPLQLMQAQTEITSTTNKRKR